MANAVFCIATSAFQAESIVNELKLAGFSDHDISVLFPGKTGAKNFVPEQASHASERVVTGASAFGVVGGALGWLAGIGALIIPGAGPFVAAGPIMAALGGAAVGAAVGGIAGALVGMGIPENEARRYEGKIKAGQILISVHSESPDESKHALEIFEQAGALDISTSSEGEVNREKESHSTHRDRSQKI